MLYPLAAMRSTVWRVSGDVARNLVFPAFAIGQQFGLVIEQLFAGLGGELEIRTFDDGIHRAGFLEEAAIDALRHVDIVARGAARAVLRSEEHTSELQSLMRKS